jgi:TonB family protein
MPPAPGAAGRSALAAAGATAGTEPVARVLTERARRHAAARGLPWLAAAAALHLAVLGLALVLPTLRQPPPPLEFVPVQIIPAQALGVERPRARREGSRARQAAAVPTPPAPSPEPLPEPEPRRPEPEPEPEDDRPALPEPKKDDKKKPEPPQPARDTRKPPAPEPRKSPAPAGGDRSADRRTEKPSAGRTAQSGAEIPKGDEAGRRGSAAGNPLGTSAFGSAIAGLEDPNFGYGYYIDRLLQLIDANWNRPALGNEVRAVLHFRILRNGQIEDLRVVESSGYNSFDLAALRAVQNAVPFPILPASYRADSLGVNLIVR